MAELPDDTIAVYLAVRRPCEHPEHRRPGGGCAVDGWWRCEGCQDDGTRIIPTEVEVVAAGERREQVIWREAFDG